MQKSTIINAGVGQLEYDKESDWETIWAKVGWTSLIGCGMKQSSSPWGLKLLADLVN